MAASCEVVIGANYGDEGKGLITDRLAASAPGPAGVIRFNSSAQAAHTVVTPGGRRHVFHHVGSGSFAGASTVLSRFFVAHPMLLGEELAALASLGVSPRLYADPRAHVATPYDVLLNQLAEEKRGARRHGSCGIGFNEAVERSLRPRFCLSVAGLASPLETAARLRAIRDEWVPRRLAHHGIAALTAEQQDLLAGEALIESFLRDAEFFHDMVHMLEPGSLPPAEFIIFEGAQGLALDEQAAGFPHVTRSRTGLANVITLARETDLEHLRVTYVTRAFLTRHGAGPLPGERDGPPAPGVDDPTNRPNPWQGQLRFADLDVRALTARIQRDLAFHADGITASAALAVTCLDQMENQMRVVDGTAKDLTTDDLPDFLSRATGLPVRFESRGPSRNDVAGTLPGHYEGARSRTAA